MKITTMPNKPNGQKYTPVEFFDYFRRNINNFANQLKSLIQNNPNMNLGQIANLIN